MDTYYCIAIKASLERIADSLEILASCVQHEHSKVTKDVNHFFEVKNEEPKTPTDKDGWEL